MGNFEQVAGLQESLEMLGQLEHVELLFPLVPVAANPLEAGRAIVERVRCHTYFGIGYGNDGALEVGIARLDACRRRWSGRCFHRPGRRIRHCHAAASFAANRSFESRVTPRAYTARAVTGCARPG